MEDRMPNQQNPGNSGWQSSPQQGGQERGNPQQGGQEQGNPQQGGQRHAGERGIERESGTQSDRGSQQEGGQERGMPSEGERGGQQR
jgi:protein Tex